MWFGGPIAWFKISLLVRSDALDPEAVTSVFEVRPDTSQKKGIPLLSGDGSIKRIPKFGSWTISITPDETDEWDVEQAAWLLLNRLPKAIESWALLPEDADVSLSFGLNLESKNQGFSVGSDLASFAGQRNIQLALDIYHEEK